jgi:hypothetical protein
LPIKTSTRRNFTTISSGFGRVIVNIYFSYEFFAARHAAWKKGSVLPEGCFAPSGNRTCSLQNDPVKVWSHSACILNGCYLLRQS